MYLSLLLLLQMLIQMNKEISLPCLSFFIYLYIHIYNFYNAVQRENGKP